MGGVNSPTKTPVSRQICLDTGVLIGELTPPINQELAKIQISKERGR